MESESAYGRSASLASFPELHFGAATVQPVLVCDTREQAPLTFSRLPSVTGTLATGDYSVLGWEQAFAVERKSIPDLVGCCIGDNRSRFERELCRLRGFQFKRLLIVGSQRAVREGYYRSNVSPQAVLASANCWQIRYDVPVVWSGNPEEAASLVETWAYWFVREQLLNIDKALRQNTIKQVDKKEEVSEKD